MPELKMTLHKDKTTPGTVRFKEKKDNHPLVIYLDKGRVEELGEPASIKVTIEPEA